MKLHQARIPDKSLYENHIQIENINHIDKAKFFTKMTDKHKQINNELITLCKEVFEESYNKGGKEAGAVLNINTGKTAIHEATNFRYVDFTEDKEKEYYAIYTNSEKYSCILIHNHNETNSFSAGDLYNFLKDDVVIAIIVITCKADIFILLKEKNIDYSEILYTIDTNYKTDYITYDVRELMDKYNVIERRIL